MLRIEDIKKQIDDHRLKYNAFQDSERMGEYRLKYQETLDEALNSFQKCKPRFQKLMLNSSTKGYTSMKECVTSEEHVFSINLRISKMFSAGYSTNVDLEIQKDHDIMEREKNVDISREDKHPLFNGAHSKLYTNLGEIIIAIKNIPQKPAFPERFEILPFNTMGICETDNKEYYEESESLADQLAYHFYENNTIDAEAFCRLGDHHRFQGINGLSVALYFLIENYAYKGENTYKQPISAHTDMIKKSSIIEEFNKIFTGYFEIDATSEPGYMIYKLLKQ